MALKLYLNIANNPFSPGTPKGTWDNISSTLTVPMGSAPFGTGIESLQVTESTIVAPYSVLLIRGVSSKLQAQNISGTLDLILGIYQDSSDSDFFWHIHAWVTQGNTDVIRGTLINNYKENTNEWTGGYTLGYGTKLAAPVALTPVNALAGDRIVIEIGYVSRNTISSGRTGKIFYGSKLLPLHEDVPDLAVGSNFGTTQAGTITFSQNILFEDVPSQISHVLNQIVDEVPAAPARIAHVVMQATEVTSPIARIAHILIQVAQGTPTPVVPGTDLSGIYFVNPTKVDFHDSYYDNIEKKIPNPTIKTALFGE